MLRPGFLFQAIQGTSMASPHVAGAGALLTQAHPTLSPAELKSELMLTANPDVLKEDGKTPADAFDRGSGEIDPNQAADSGLVLDDERPTTTSSYLECVDPTIVNGDIPTTRPNDLNLPSISFSKFGGQGLDDARVQERRLDRDALDGVLRGAARASRRARRPGSSSRSSPARRRRSRSTLQVTTAPLNKYAFGALVLTSGSRTLRVPISVKPVPVAAPAKVTVNDRDRRRHAADPGATPASPGQLSGVGWGLATPDVRPASGSRPRAAARTRAAATRARSCTR